MFCARDFLINIPSKPRSLEPDPVQRSPIEICRTLASSRSTRFRVSTAGGHDLSEFHFMYPEQQSDAPELINSRIDCDTFADCNARLTPEQSNALRGRVIVSYEGDPPQAIYCEGVDMSSCEFNFSVNSRLATRAADREIEHDTASHLAEALNLFPTVHGEFCCLVEHEPARPSPWGRTIHVNDIVSCTPCFLPAFSSLQHARDTFTKGGFLDRVETDTVVIYKISTTECGSTAVPLYNGIASFNPALSADLVLFKQNSYFSVEGVAIAGPIK